MNRWLFRTALGDDNSRGAWWHGPLIGGVMTLCTGVAGFVGTHWGGVTNDQMTAALKTQSDAVEKKIDEVKAIVAKNADEQKKYIDVRTAPVAAPVKKKHPKPTGEQREQ